MQHIARLHKDGTTRWEFLSFLVASKKPELRNLPLGEGVYLLRVQVTDSRVLSEIQRCGSCASASTEPNPARANVSFPKVSGILINSG